jgi:hypothetical protein
VNKEEMEVGEREVRERREGGGAGAHLLEIEEPGKEQKRRGKKATAACLNPGQKSPVTKHYC